MKQSDPRSSTGSAGEAPTMAAGVSLLSDLTYRSSGEIKANMEPVSLRVPTAKYTKVGETLRHVIPGHMQCSMACGGRACKYENPSRWSDKEQAIKGLYSSWITDNLLATSRPSTEIIEKYNIIEQFQRCGLKTVINLQRPGEHASCGNPLEPESGFTYRPETFMQAGIYFYNFGWKDYGVASLTTILDMVKVMSFAIQEGKMAIHCHAGLGRTGVLLACYLVFTSRMSADQAILFVRAKRPNSIQTRGQLLCVREFAQFLVPLRSVFSCAEPKAHPVTLTQYLTRQRHLLHGYEARQMKNVPKVVKLVCRLLMDIAENREVVNEEVVEVPDLTAEVEKTVSQQAIQQLGKEMRGKGIPVPSPRSSLGAPALPKLLSVPLNDQPLYSDQELDLLWRCQDTVNHQWPQCILNRSLSDSALDRLNFQLSQLENPMINSGTSHKPITTLSLSQSSLGVMDSTQSPTSNHHDHSRTSSPNPFLPTRSDEEHKKVQSRQPLKPGQRSMSLGFSVESRDNNSSAMITAWKAEGTSATPEAQGELMVAPVSDDADFRNAKDLVTEIPFIMLQSELTLEARRIVVAKALAMESDDEELRNKVTKWQTELNNREGAWERLCTERDPLVLCTLMWSWLEQLREPIISKEDVEVLREKNYIPQEALNSLEKGHKHTLLCIIDCAAHLLDIPEDVENSVLDRIIKAFTKVDCGNGLVVFVTLRGILAPVLRDMRTKAVEDLEEALY
ncbi:protein tyrosine phosphatase domain-containing protein 1 isoform X2 [Denticeps clupeoides]|uniref:Protein tyrosine phosphatase domain-containing protein 1 n=2 Tax=Denticeps clupeoides TaxID=299321 RepID=A0AAY4EH59_9TELE|nr:protein tyrosine phosphatase domain-containing protein 1 isoform X2 [Denticeps clupeoides]